MEERVCRYCEGKGKYTCTACSGVGSKIEPNLAYISLVGRYIPETRICYACKGSGIIKCSYCDGTGRY